MPRKTATVDRVRTLSTGFNEAAARCRGKLRAWALSRSRFDVLQ